MTAVQPPTAGSPYNHAGHDSCDGRLPLTLADRQRLHRRPFIRHDQTRDYHQTWCTECLKDLPHGFAALFHVCDPGPAPAARKE